MIVAIDSARGAVLTACSMSKGSTVTGQVQRVTDNVRVLLDRALSGSSGNQYKPIKILREMLGTANDLVGRPLCTQAELDRRRARARAGEQAPAPAPREPAPVMVYFDGQDHRTLKKVEELLKSRAIPYKMLDCTDDEATRAWATAASHMHEFPIVFIAGESVGGLHEITQLDVNGILKKRVFGA